MHFSAKWDGTYLIIGTLTNHGTNKYLPTFFNKPLGVTYLVRDHWCFAPVEMSFEAKNRLMIPVLPGNSEHNHGGLEDDVPLQMLHGHWNMHLCVPTETASL